MSVHDLIAQSPSAHRWPTVFSPGTLRGREVKNRIVSTPHSTGWGHDGLITEAEVDYHVRKAAGGVGLVMTFGSASVDPDSAASYGSISLWDERNDTALPDARAAGARARRPDHVADDAHGPAGELHPLRGGAEGRRRTFPKASTARCPRY